MRLRLFAGDSFFWGDYPHFAPSKEVGDHPPKLFRTLRIVRQGLRPGATGMKGVPGGLYLLLSATAGVVVPESFYENSTKAQTFHQLGETTFQSGRIVSAVASSRKLEISR